MVSSLNETEVGDQFTSLEALIEVLAGPDCGLARVRGSRVRNSQLLGWLETRAGLDSAGLARIQALFKRLGTNPSLLLFALRYTLTPDAPLELCPGVAARSPAELAATLLGAWPDIESPLKALGMLAASGRLEEWLRASEPPAWQWAVQAIEFVRTCHPGELELPCWLLLWAYGAKSPFPFNGGLVETPPDLARAIDASDRSREEGLRRLDAGWIRAWLITTRHIAEPAAWDAAVQDTKIAPSVRLAAALRQLDPDRPAPALRATPAQLDFGTIRRGEQRQLELRFDTLNRESVACSLSIQDAGVPIALNVTHLEAIPATIQVSAGDRGLAAGHRVETAILVNGGGAELRVPVRFRVAASDAAGARRFSPAVIMILLAGAGGLGWWYFHDQHHHGGSHTVGTITPPPTPTPMQPGGTITLAGVANGLDSQKAPRPFATRFVPTDGPLVYYVSYAGAQVGTTYHFEWWKDGTRVSNWDYSLSYDNGNIWSWSPNPLQRGRYEARLTVNGELQNLTTIDVVEAAPVAVQNTEETAFVNTLQLNIRNGPGPDYASLTKVPQGTPIRVLERRSVGEDALWARIEVQGISCWVNMKLLSATPVAPPNIDPSLPGPISTPVSPPSTQNTGETAYVNTILLNVRNGPGPDYASVTKVPQGTPSAFLSVGQSATMLSGPESNFKESMAGSIRSCCQLSQWQRPPRRRPLRPMSLTRALNHQASIALPLRHKANPRSVAIPDCALSTEILQHCIARGAKDYRTRRVRVFEIANGAG
jgi:uncharacterized protein YraI